MPHGWRGLAALVVIATLVAACSSSEGDGATTTATATTTMLGEVGSASADLADITIGTSKATFEWPVDAVARPGHDELYVVERNGRITTLVDGARGATVLDLGYDLSAFTEDGLLGLTFALDGSLAYVQRTKTDLETSTGLTEIVEYQVADDGTFDTSSERIVYTIEQPYHQHQGGELLIGPDGMLWIPTGDGGGEDDPDRRALDPTLPHGKLLRIDPTPTAADEAAGRGWSVPPDNPFVEVEGVLPEIWSSGLRSPWKASFDSATGDLWIGDVGAFTIEELDVVWADEGLGRGDTYGWSALEASAPFNTDQDATASLPGASLVEPFYEFPHESGRCAISAGVRYRGTALPELAGWVVFAELCTGEVVALEVKSDRTAGRVVHLGVVEQAVAVRADADGELWVLSYKGGIQPLVRKG